MTISPGEWLAIAGPSGAGKSTLLNSLLGSCLSFMGRYGHPVFQEPFPASSPWSAKTITSLVVPCSKTSHSVTRNPRKNGPGKPFRRLARLFFFPHIPTDLNDKRANEGRACQGANANGYVLRVRFIAKMVLVLDEPTNQLDADVLNTILAALERQRGQRTIICVAHDLSLTSLADRVVFVDGDGQHMIGTHPELYAASPASS